MATPATLQRYTTQEYLAIEREAAFHSELLDGEIVAMTSASREHNVIAVNIGGELRNHFADEDCESYISDMRVRIPDANTYLYPDVAVVCGGPALEDDRRDTVLNPRVIFEIRSPTTALYDRTTKLANYSRIPTLTDYLLVAQDKPQVEHYTRSSPEGDWDIAIVSGLDSVVDLSSIGCVLALAEVYRRVAFA